MKELDVVRVRRTNELIGEWLLNYLHLRVYMKFLVLIFHALDFRESLIGTFNGFLRFFKGFSLRYFHLISDELERSSQLLGLLQTCFIFFIKQHEKRDDFLGLQNSDFNESWGAPGVPFGPFGVSWCSHFGAPEW